MRAAVTFVLSFVVSTLAYMVTFPCGDDGTGWTTQGPQMVQWTSAKTDPPHFVLNLTNKKIPNFAPFTLANNVDATPGNPGSLQVNPPHGGFPSGSAFRLNFVTTRGNTILAQSHPFNITSSSSTPATSGGSVTDKIAAQGATTDVSLNPQTSSSDWMAFITTDQTVTTSRIPAIGETATFPMPSSNTDGSSATSSGILPIGSGRIHPASSSGAASSSRYSGLLQLALFLLLGFAFVQ